MAHWPAFSIPLVCEELGMKVNHLIVEEVMSCAHTHSRLLEVLSATYRVFHFVRLPLILPILFIPRSTFMAMTLVYLDAKTAAMARSLRTPREASGHENSLGRGPAWKKIQMKLTTIMVL